MSQSLRRLALVSILTVLAATVAVWEQPDADAGLATSVGLVANLSYPGPTTDLIVSFRLVERLSGRVIWQAAPGEINAVHTDSTRIRYSTNLLPGEWWFTSGHEWSCRIDARNATTSVFWIDFSQWVDAGVYTSVVPTASIQGRTSESLLLGQVNDFYL